MAHPRNQNALNGVGLTLRMRELEQEMNAVKFQDGASNWQPATILSGSSILQEVLS